MKVRKIDGYDCSFHHNWDRYRTFSSNNIASDPMLLVGFCSFYGSRFKDVIEREPCLGIIKHPTYNPPPPHIAKQTRDLKICRLVSWTPFITGMYLAGSCLSNKCGRHPKKNLAQTNLVFNR